jgi:hypothetical protein|tara:strand:+ start:3253 stop:3984 length:732 start_codon:yes stop_codon:yes gene_type:complete
MKNKMMLHCGGKEVGFEELAAVPLPEETNTYVPVSFADIVNNTKMVADDLLKGYEYDSSQYALAGKDQRFFGVHFYKGDDFDDQTPQMHQAIGMRSSYDKSMANGICAGARIFVCDNMSFFGEITIMRKHTKNVIQDLQDELVKALYRANHSFLNLVEDADIMADKPLTNNKAYEFIGKLYGHNVLKPRQLAETFRHWKNPPYEEFQDKNMWSLYNACTESLKSTPPNRILEQHIKLHKYATA